MASAAVLVADTAQRVLGLSLRALPQPASLPLKLGPGLFLKPLVQRLDRAGEPLARQKCDASSMFRVFGRLASACGVLLNGRFAVQM